MDIKLISQGASAELVGIYIALMLSDELMYREIVTENRLERLKSKIKEKPSNVSLQS